MAGELAYTAHLDALRREAAEAHREALLSLNWYERASRAYQTPETIALLAHQEAVTKRRLARAWAESNSSCACHDQAGAGH